jgi:hypothetical protein
MTRLSRTFVYRRWPATPLLQGLAPLERFTARRDLKPLIIGHPLQDGPRSPYGCGPKARADSECPRRQTPHRCGETSWLAPVQPGTACGGAGWRAARCGATRRAPRARDALSEVLESVTWAPEDDVN